MAISSLISGIFGIAESSLNLGSQILTNESNERNVNSTNKANKEMTDATNAANIKIAQENNASNERIMQENNAFNAAQADLAYQRSTSAAKLGELISAGLSPEQARQVIASQGLTGTPSSATGTAIPSQAATMQSPHFESFQKQPPQLSGLPEIGKNLGDFAQSFVEAAKDPTGGTIGQLSCMKVFAKASDIIDEVDPKSLSSTYEFFKWMKAQPAESNWGKLTSTTDFQRMWNNPISRKAFMFNINQWFGQTASTAYNLEQQENNNRLIVAQLHSTDLSTKLTNALIYKTNADTKLTEAEIIGQSTSNSREAILLERDTQLKNLITDSQKARFSQELADSKLQLDLIQKPEYRNAYFASCIGNLAASAAMYSFTEWKYNKLQEGYDKVLDPDTEAVFLVLEDLGFADTPIYEDMLKSVAQNSNLTTFLMGKGWKGVPFSKQGGTINGYEAYKYSLDQWSRDMEKIRYEALRPFYKREDIKFGISQATGFVIDAAKAIR